MRASWIIYVVVGLAALSVPAVSVGTPHPLARTCLNTTIGHLDATPQAADAFPRDVIFGKGEQSSGTSAAYFGDSSRFRELRVNVGQEGIDGATSWRYWAGSSWEHLDVSGNFDSAGWTTLAFKKPHHWAPVQAFSDTCTGSFYFIKAHTEEPYTIPPFLSQVLVQA